MIKRLMDAKKEFGVILPPKNQNYTSNVSVEYGTVVRIVECVSMLQSDLVETSEGLLPRYVINTHGIYRFKLVSVKLNDDGYFDGEIERVDDLEPEDMIQGWKPSYLEDMCNEAKDCFERMMSAMPECAQRHLIKKYGNMPSDPNDLSFWLASMLPLSPYTIAELLPMHTVCDRMKMVCKWLKAME
jgi:Lon protease-like protein